jgi:hypothetical protein
MRLPIEEPCVSGRREIPATDRVATPTFCEMAEEVDAARAYLHTAGSESGPPAAPVMTA